MRLIQKQPIKIAFSSEIEDSLANAIRRYVFHIPTLAVDEVEISRNDSPLYDETIAHRIGLLPLENAKSFNEKNPAKLKLSTKKEGTVYSEDLKGNIKVIYDKVPITTLSKNQEIELEATIRSGKGVEHSKFSPGFMAYRNVVEAQIDKNIPQEMAKHLPEKMLKGAKIIIETPSDWDLIEKCAEECKKQRKDYIKVTPKQDLIIEIESFGQMDVEEIFKRSIEELKKDLNRISKELSKI